MIVAEGTVKVIGGYVPRFATIVGKPLPVFGKAVVVACHDAEHKVIDHRLHIEVAGNRLANLFGRGSALLQVGHLAYPACKVDDSQLDLGRALLGLAHVFRIVGQCIIRRTAVDELGTFVIGIALHIVKPLGIAHLESFPLQVVKPEICFVHVAVQVDVEGIVLLLCHVAAMLGKLPGADAPELAIEEHHAREAIGVAACILVSLHACTLPDAVARSRHLLLHLVEELVAHNPNAA